MDKHLQPIDYEMFAYFTEPKFKRILGMRIASLRIEHDFSREKLSERIDVCPSCIHKIEHGDVFPTLITVMKIATLFRVSLDELLKKN